MQRKKINIKYANSHHIKFAILAKNVKVSPGQIIEVRINSESKAYKILKINCIEIDCLTRKFLFIVKQLELFGGENKTASPKNPNPLEFGIFGDFFEAVRPIKGTYFSGFCITLESLENGI